MIRGNRRAAAALVAAAAALAPLLTACGGSGGGHDTAGAAVTGSPSHPPASAPASAGVSAPGADDAKGASKAPAGPKAMLPDDKITPATGTFTAKEKKYLAGRVPVGNDPAAILQSGQETCDRIASVSKVDRDAAVGAIIAGEITGAKAAIENLCPKLEPVLADTAGGLADGTHTHPAAGRYRALTPTKSCTWQAGSASGSGTTVTIRTGTKSFSSSGCYAWMRL